MSYDGTRDVVKEKEYRTFILPVTINGEKKDIEIPVEYNYKYIERTITDYGSFCLDETNTSLHNFSSELIIWDMEFWTINKKTKKSNNSVGSTFIMDFLNKLLEKLGVDIICYYGYSLNIKEVKKFDIDGLSIELYNNDDKNKTSIEDDYEVTITPNFGITIELQEGKEGENGIKKVTIEENAIPNLFNEIANWFNTLDINELIDSMGSDIRGT